MDLQLYSENKQSKWQWPIERMFLNHNGYSFTVKNIIVSKQMICFSFRAYYVELNYKNWSIY